MSQQIQSRLVCRCSDRTATTSSVSPKLDILAVDGGEEPQEEWQAEDDVKERQVDPHEFKTDRQKETQYSVGQGGV